MTWVARVQEFRQSQKQSDTAVLKPSSDKKELPKLTNGILTAFKVSTPVTLMYKLKCIDQGPGERTRSQS